MLKEGTCVYFIEEGHVYSGRVRNLQGNEKEYTFQIDSYGTCEGQYTIASHQLGKTIFLDAEEAHRHLL